MVEYRLNIGHGLLKYPLSILVLLLITACGPDSQQHRSQANPQLSGTTKTPTSTTGRVIRHAEFASEFVPSRHVDVWVPEGFDPRADLRYNVLVMHDGQNLFDPALGYGGHVWHVDVAAQGLIDNGFTGPFIVVGVWNTDRRFREYYPQAAYNALPDSVKAQLDEGRGAGGIHSDAYLRFLVEELLPFIRDSYPVNSGPDHTAVMGSSMGGLISLYALTRYPEVFGAAGNVSTHWPIMMENPDNRFAGPFFDWLRANLPAPDGNHRFYFDYGTETLDAIYEPFQLEMDALMREAGFREGTDFVSYKFEGAAHSEPSWAERVHIPLEFIMSPR